MYSFLKKQIKVNYVNIFKQFKKIIKFIDFAKFFMVNCASAFIAVLNIVFACVEINLC